MKDQVLSIDQMRHLRDLNIDTSKASLYWVRHCHGCKIDDDSTGEWFLSLQKEFQVIGFMSYEVIPTFTLQDLLNVIPPRVSSRSNEVFSLRIERCIDEWGVYYRTIIECDDRSELARLKLIQIYKASNILNNNWKLTPLGTQCAFYPSFTWKKGKIVCGDICHTLYSVSYDPKLCCGKEDDAFYIGTHFIDLYRDYLLLEVKEEHEK